MENRDAILERFAAGLNQALLNKYGKLPSTSQFASLFNACTIAQNHITRETARKWIKGLAYPEVSRLHVLMQWLGLNPGDILDVTGLGSGSGKSARRTRGDTGRAQADGNMPVKLAQQTLDALTAHIAVIDAEGFICQVNQSWRDFARANDGQEALQTGIGLNYLEVCDNVRSNSAAVSAAMAQGMRAVLQGSLKEFALKYPCHSPTERRWFIVRTTGFEQDGRRYAVVSHESVSEDNWHKLDFPDPTVA